MGTTLLVQGSRFKPLGQVENLFQNVCIKGFTTKDAQTTHVIKASEIIAEMYPEDEQDQHDDEEEYLDQNHFSAPLATFHRSQPMDMNFKSLPVRRRPHHDEEDTKGFRCRTEWEKRAEYESKLEELNQKLFKSPKKGSCLFMKMFQARCPQLTCAMAAKRYATMYLRNSDSLLASLSRSEKSFITQFKYQHSQLNREEWSYLQGFIPADLTQESLSDSVFNDFVNLIERSQSPPPSKESHGSPSRSMLHMLLQPRSSAGTQDRPSKGGRKLSMAESFKLYFCIQFSNYEELWDSSHVVLDSSLKQSIEKYLEEHPVAHGPLFNMFLDMLNVLDS